MSKKYWLMVNEYRTSTDGGFTNTWGARGYRSRTDRDAALRDGLPVRDQWDADGHPCLSTMGLRLPTAQERRELNADADRYEVE